jgi:GTP-binding protein Era
MPKNPPAANPSEDIEAQALPPGFKSGFVAILGRPNAGKSTLVNRLVGEKVAIVTPRPQTTRNRIQGIVNRPDAQIVLIDTPGIHDPESALGRMMMDEVEQALDGIDAGVLVVDAARPHDPADGKLREVLKDLRGPVILALNKIDVIAKPHLLPLIDAWHKEHDFREIIPISARTGDGCGILLEALVNLLPEGQPYFPRNQSTDQPERFLAAEIIREKAIRATREEVPYSIAVIVNRFEESDRLVRIYATILVERYSHKGILIGKGGSMLKGIGTDARMELEKILGVHLFLDLLMKVDPGWRNDPRKVRQLDWHRQLEGWTGEEET